MASKSMAFRCSSSNCSSTFPRGSIQRSSVQLARSHSKKVPKCSGLHGRSRDGGLASESGCEIERGVAEHCRDQALPPSCKSTEGNAVYENTDHRESSLVCVGHRKKDRLEKHARRRESREASELCQEVPAVDELFADAHAERHDT